MTIYTLNRNILFICRNMKIMIIDIIYTFFISFTSMIKVRGYNIYC